jgi:hypothetical protein
MGVGAVKTPTAAATVSSSSRSSLLVVAAEGGKKPRVALGFRGAANEAL